MAVNRLVTTPEWVNVQHKTMIRWINSQLDIELTDLSKDLDDGLILILLINKIVTEIDLESTDLKLYLLTPLYKNPKFGLQKLENVNDFLEFLRIVLKINTTGITSEHIVNGNLKLILGLIWSIFIFSTSNSIGILNDGNSIIEIKSILLTWVNKNFKLSAITNFNRDWSLEINLPDMIFQSILKNYLPSSKIIKFLENKFQNLKSIIQFAEQLGIKKLADIEDFKTLVPDEKSILFYLLEWYQFFELNIHGFNFDLGYNKDIEGVLSKGTGKLSSEQSSSPSPSQAQSQSQSPDNLDDTYDDVIIQVLEVIKSKYEYETKSLRLSNKINTINNKTQKILKGIKDNNLFGLLRFWEYQYEEKINHKEFTKEFNELTEELIDEMNKIVIHLQNYEELNNISSQLMYHDIKQLEHIHKQLKDDLSLINKDINFQVSQSLKIDNLQIKIDRLIHEQTNHNDIIKTFNESILNNPIIKKINDYLVKLEKFLQTNNHQPNDVDGLLNPFDKLIDFIHKIDYSLRNLSITRSPKHLKYIKPTFNESLREAMNLRYDNLKQKLLQFDQTLIANEHEFSSIMLTLTSIDLNPSYIKSFINLVPMKIVNLNFNDSDFSLVPDDSDNDTTNDSEIDNSSLIFEGSRRKVSNQLGSDKVYDLTGFFSRFEDGLKL